MLHIWSYGGPCHEVVNGEDYWHCIYGRTVVHVTKLYLLLALHIWSYGGPCHEVVNGEDYWHSIYGRTVVHVTIAW